MIRIRLIMALVLGLALFSPAFAEAPEGVVSIRGPMPGLSDAAAWSNTNPLTPKEFKGKVLIVHFWAFGAGNGVENFGTYAKWNEEYRDKGVLTFGIYSPMRGAAIVDPREFDGKQPKLPQLIEKAKKEGFSFPSAWDTPERKVGHAWKVEEPSTVFLIDRKGQLRYRFSGDLTVANGEAEEELNKKLLILLKELP